MDEKSLVVVPNKSLGQHWLSDINILNRIADYADIKKTDTVLEIGPGLGYLTSVLSERSDSLIAVEFDRDLANELRRIKGQCVNIINQDFLKFDLSNLNKGYKVVANIPYYITAKIIHKLLNADNKPSIAVLLIQKEVAERLVAREGDMSILSISAQLYADVELGVKIPPEMFTPPPKVDSQVIIIKPRTTPLFDDIDEKKFFRIVKAGFGEKRKKLKSSLAGGLAISKAESEQLLWNSNIDPNLRAQDLTLQQWRKLSEQSII